MAINLTSKKILIVEDQAMMRETIKHILSIFGAQLIVETGSGINAIAAMKVEIFDIVLCDYHLSSGKNGQQVLEEARYLKLLPTHAIFIMVTCVQGSDLVLSAIDNKPDAYLIKPFNQKQLLIRIEKCLAQKTQVASIENEIDKGNFYQAIQHCEKLLQLEDKKSRMQLLKMRAELTLKVGDFHAAEAIYQQILDEKELPWARLGLGVVAFFLGNYLEAIDLFQEMIDQYPAMLEAYDWLVKAHEALGDDNHAFSLLNSAVELSPTSILRQKKLALLAEKTENIDIAKKAYTTTIKLGKHSIHRSASDYSGLANIFLKSNAPNDALKIVQELNQQFQNNLEAKLRAMLLETLIYQAKGDKTLAQEAYGKVFALNEQFNKQLSRELRLEMAKTFYLNGNGEACDEVLNDLIKTNIDDKIFIKDIATMCNSIIGEHHLEALIQEIRIELVDINNQGIRLFQEGNIKGALSAFDRAIKKMPDNHTIILNMIKIMIHDLKASKVNLEKINSAQFYINKAIETGMPHNQISGFQSELDIIQNRNLAIT